MFYRHVAILFYIDIAKVDRDVTHVASVSKDVARVCLKYFVYFRRILQMFYLMLYMLQWLCCKYIFLNVSSVLVVCYNCFI
jgi:hypothetical protein